MSAPAATVPVALPAKAPKKKTKNPRKKTGPSVSDLILKAVAASKDRGGVSLAALKKVLKAGGYDVVKNRVRLATAIKRLVKNKSLVRTKGTGASGRFKINKKAPASKKKKRVVKKKAKKPKAKKAKKAKKVKKAAGATTAAKKSPKKKKPKSPKKTKKPAAAKKPKKPKSPKKAKRKVVKAAKTRAAAKK